MNITYTATGHRCGETHHRARYPDSLVLAVRNEHEFQGMSLRALAIKYSASLAWVRMVCHYRRRVSVATRAVRQ